MSSIETAPVASQARAAAPSEVRRLLREPSAVIGATMEHRVPHGIDQKLIDGLAVEMHYANDSTHGGMSRGLGGTHVEPRAEVQDQRPGRPTRRRR